jgi:HK97 gp10 family phage protein
MASDEITWDGKELRAFSATLDGISGRLAPAVVTAMRETGEAVAKRAKELAPKGKTGRMARSIRSDLTDKGGAEVTVEVGPTVYYGRFLEHGTSKMSPRPFLAPAAEEYTDALADAVLGAAARAVSGE